MQRILTFVVLLTLLAAARVRAAESLTLTDGAALSGDIMKSDEFGVMLHLDSDTYTNVVWSRFSQESLKHLAGDPKFSEWVTPFIEPAGGRSAASEVTLKPVTRLQAVEHPSVFAGFFRSGVGVMVLVLIYLGNLYAGFEVALVRNRPVLQVLAVAAVLPIFGPLIYVYLPVVIQAPVVLEAPEGTPPEIISMGTAAASDDPAAGKPGEPPTPKTQVFPRGRYTFNKRFVETRFAGFVGQPREEALTFTMSLKTSHEELSVQQILQVGAAELVLQTAERGQVTVPLADIQEVKLNPINA